ncbi:hypothetical protein [Burkholderia gladioli]|uniref:hypothetical protein n=1 Tax=Burkholderia gladioli TaxID=28095 RepID=UPI00163E15D4|nr:hypothetical protein [Burkholderia gladioli]MDN7755402.1 hypothetical protein [Burkholderia gladioli]
MSMCHSLPDAAAAPGRPPAGEIPYLEGLGKRVPVVTALDGIVSDTRRSGRQAVCGVPVQAPGSAIIHQELTFVPHLGVAGNRYLHRETKRDQCADTHRLEARASRCFMRTGLTGSPSARIGTRSIAQQPMVQIAKRLPDKLQWLERYVADDGGRHHAVLSASWGVATTTTSTLMRHALAATGEHGIGQSSGIAALVGRDEAREAIGLGPRIDGRGWGDAVAKEVGLPLFGRVLVQNASLRLINTCRLGPVSATETYVGSMLPRRSCMMFVCLRCSFSGTDQAAPWGR